MGLDGYRYAIWPKLVPDLFCSSKEFKKIRFGENMARNKFTYKNLYIKDMSVTLSQDEYVFTIWCICFIGCYWYHNDQEKKIHFQYFLDKFVAFPMLNVAHKKKILSYLVDSLKTFGTPLIQLECITYLITKLRTQRDIKDLVDW